MNVRDWLPADALDCAAVRDVAAAAAESWSQKWFAAAGLSVADFGVRLFGASRDLPDWRVHPSGIALAGATRDMLRLAGLALGVAPDALVLSEVDRDIISRFTSCVAADFALSLTRAFGLDAPAEGEVRSAADPLPDGGLFLTLVDGTGNIVLHCALPAAMLVPFIKTAHGPPRARRAPTTPLSQALAASPVGIEAWLGDATMPLADFAALNRGDVLMLDRPLEHGVELAFSCSGRTFARGALAEGDAAVSLILSPQDREKP